MKISGICSSHGYYKGEYCSKCRQEISKIVPYGFVRTERGKRTDIEFRSESLEDNMRRYGRDI